MKITELQNLIGKNTAGEYVLSNDECKIIIDAFEKQLAEKFGAINIILDHEEGTTNIAFVEIENDKGESIAIGDSESDGAYSKLRISASDIFNHPAI